MLDITGKDLTKIYDLSRKILDYYRYLLETEKIDASGTLSRTADFDVEFDDFHIAVYFILESYWYYVEKGRNKSTGKFGTWSTKLLDIENWLRQKIARGTFVPSGRHTIPRTDKEIKKVSYVIARKITNFGYYGTTHEGKHPLENALKEAETAGIIDEMIDCVMDAFDKRVELELMKI